MTLEQILALLIAKFSGVRKDGLSQLARGLALQAANDEEAKALVEKLTKAQVDDFVKEFRAEVDKEVSDSNKTFETNLKKKFDLVEKKEPDPKKDGDPNDIATMVTNAVAAAVKPLQEKLEKYEQGGVAKSRLQTLTDKLKDCKDETFKAKALKDFARIVFDSEEAFNEYLKETETDIATANQNVADLGLASHEKPFFTEKTKEGVSSGVADFLDSQKPDGKELTGKEV